MGHPVRIVNQDSINGSQTDWTALVNDSDADGDGVFGIQLTDTQRQELANTITNTDGLRPYDLGSGSVISPLSKPNEGEETSRCSNQRLRSDSFISKRSPSLQYCLL